MTSTTVGALPGSSYPGDLGYPREKISKMDKWTKLSDMKLKDTTERHENLKDISF